MVIRGNSTFGCKPALGLCAAVAADTAYFRAGDADFDVAVFGDLGFELFIELGFDFADFAAADAGYVNVVAGTVAFVVVAVAAQVQQIQLVDQSETFQQLERPVDRYLGDVGIDFLGALEDFVGVHVLGGGFHDLEHDAALAREADAARL